MTSIIERRLTPRKERCFIFPKRYEHTGERRDTRAGYYDRKYQTQAGEMNLKMPKLRKLPFETSIIDGFREVLGVTEGAKEDKAGWSAFLANLKERGLRGVQLFTSDACMGLVESLADYYPEVLWQRCTVHWYRNVFSLEPRAKLKEIVIMLKAIHAQEDRKAALEKVEAVAQKLDAMKLPKAGKYIRDTAAQTLSYYAFPHEHWRRIRTNNPLERIMKEIRRRTNVVGAFPDGEAALVLVAARLRHIAGLKWGTRKYLDIDLIKEQEMETQAIA